MKLGGKSRGRCLSRQVLIDKIKAGEKGWAVVSRFLPAGDEIRATLSLTVTRSEDAGVGPLRILAGDTANYPAGPPFNVPHESLWLFVELAEAVVAEADETVRGRTPSEKALAPSVGADAA